MIDGGRRGGVGTVSVIFLLDDSSYDLDRDRYGYGYQYFPMESEF